MDTPRLYDYYRSSAAYRVRIALNLKGLSYQTIPVHLVKNGGEQLSDAYRAINPQGLVPVLLHQGHVLTQSLAICEYLDECFGQYPLLPADSLQRARVRSLALQVACEIHPINNLRVQKYLKDQCAGALDTVEWMLHWMTEGFATIEQQLKNSGERHSGGEHGRALPDVLSCVADIPIGVAVVPNLNHRVALVGVLLAEDRIGFGWQSGPREDPGALLLPQRLGGKRPCGQVFDDFELDGMIA